MTTPLLGPYGPSVGDDEIEDAFVDTFKFWQAAYIAAHCDRLGIDPLEPLHVWYADELDEPHVFPPCLLVQVGAVTDEPDLNAGGAYTARYEVSLLVVAHGSDPPDTRRKVRRYAAAVRQMALQQRPRGVEKVLWVGAQTDLDGDEAGVPRNDGVAKIDLIAVVRDVVNRSGGPRRGPVLPGDVETPAPTDPPDEYADGGASVAALNVRRP